MQQVPLIKNPLYQPTKPITLNSNYAKLISGLSSSVLPPKIKLSKEDLKLWITENKALESSLDEELGVKNFKEWTKNRQTKFAPGIDIVMAPSKLTKLTPGADDVELSELDKAFGSTNI